MELVELNWKFGWIIAFLEFVYFGGYGNVGGFYCVRVQTVSREKWFY